MKLRTKNITMEKQSPFVVIVVAFLAYCLDLMDWNFLTFAAPAIAKDTGFSATQMSFLLGAPMVGAGIGGLVAGYIADKIGRVRSMVITLVWFSLFTVLFPYARTFSMMMALRLIAGFGLGAQWGIGGTLVAESVPDRYRMRASAILQSAAAVGPIIGALSVQIILPRYGWRPIFFIGGAGLLLALYVAFFLKEPQIWLDAKKKHLSGEGGLGKLTRLWEPGIRERLVACLFLNTFVSWAYYGSMSWIPSWLASTKGLGIVKSMGYMIALNMGGFIGFALFGHMADHLGRKRSSYTILLLSTAAVIGFVSINNPFWLMLFAPVYAAMTYPINGLFSGYYSELFPTDIRSTAIGGIFNVARLTAFFSPYVIAQMASTMSMTFSIGATAVFYLMAMTPLLFLPETKNRSLS